MIFIAACISLTGLCSIRVSAALGQEEMVQVIFLLDASKSMKTERHWEDMADSALLIAAALPEKYQTALLAYNSEIPVRV